MNVFTDLSHYAVKRRPYLFDLLKALVNDFSPEDRARLYGDWTRSVRLTSTSIGADIAVLPLSWNYYLENGCLPLADSFFSRANGLKVISWVSGDFGVRPPPVTMELYRASGYRSRRMPAQHGLPPFFADPNVQYFSRSSISYRKKQEKPVIGFCGQAGGGFAKYALDIARTCYRNCRYYVGLDWNEPQTISSSAYVRNFAMKLLENEPRLNTVFVRRKKYRAGQTKSGGMNRSTLEFYRNIENSDYTLCIRGGGNFSARLYETMSMGRIPILIDTDCILPWDDVLCWNDLLVYVRMSDIEELPQRILDFHSSLSESQFRQYQENARLTWLNYLSLPGFFATFLHRYSG
jgi:hypothetical protein